MNSRRTILAAAALDARFENPSVAAYNRSNKAKSERARSFWFGVGRALYRHPRGYGCPTNAERDIWDAIRRMQGCA